MIAPAERVDTVYRSKVKLLKGFKDKAEEALENYLNEQSDIGLRGYTIHFQSTNDKLHILVIHKYWSKK